MPPPPRAILPIVIANKVDGEAYGFELAADSVVTDWWRLHGAYSLVEINLQTQAGSMDTTSVAQEDASPQHQVTVRSNMDLPWSAEFNTFGRYVDQLPSQATQSYVTFDVVLTKRIGDHIEVGAVGQNLWDTHHKEFAGGTDVERGGYGRVRLWW